MIVQLVVEPMEHYTALVVAVVVVVVVVWKVLVRLSPGVHHHIAQSSRHHRHGHRHCRDIDAGKSETVKNVFFTGFWIYHVCHCWCDIAPSPLMMIWTRMVVW